jgi:hypothetical protein
MFPLDFRFRTAVRRFFHNYCFMSRSSADGHGKMSLCTLIGYIGAGMGSISILFALGLFFSLGIVFAIMLYMSLGLNPIESMQSLMTMPRPDFQSPPLIVELSVWSMITWWVILVVLAAMGFMGFVLPTINTTIITAGAGIGWCVMWLFRKTGAVKIGDVVNAVRGKACIKVDVSKLF